MTPSITKLRHYDKCCYPVLRFTYCYAGYHYAECHNAKWRNAECHYAECRDDRSVFCSAVIS
jgi:hypothetical protein